MEAETKQEEEYINFGDEVLFELNKYGKTEEDCVTVLIFIDKTQDIHNMLSNTIILPFETALKEWRSFNFRRGAIRRIQNGFGITGLLDWSLIFIDNKFTFQENMISNTFKTMVENGDLIIRPYGRVPKSATKNI